MKDSSSHIKILLHTIEDTGPRVVPRSGSGGNLNPRRLCPQLSIPLPAADGVRRQAKCPAGGRWQRAMVLHAQVL
jgi:hypothetical protein